MSRLPIWRLFTCLFGFFNGRSRTDVIPIQLSRFNTTVETDITTVETDKNREIQIRFDSCTWLLLFLLLVFRCFSWSRISEMMNNLSSSTAWTLFWLPIPKHKKNEKKERKETLRRSRWPSALCILRLAGNSSRTRGRFLASSGCTS